MAALVKKDSNYLVGRVGDWAKASAKADDILLGERDANGVRTDSGLFSWFVSKGIDSVDHLKKREINKMENPIISPDLFDALTIATFEVSAHPNAVLMCKMTHDDPRLNGSGAVEGIKRTAMTKENRSYWNEQKGSKMKDLRESFDSYLKRNDDDDDSGAGGARTARTLLARCEAAITDLKKAFLAAEKDTKNDQRVSYPTDKSGELATARALVKDLEAELKILDEAKELPTEE